MDPRDIDWQVRRRLDDAEVEAVSRLVDRVTAADGIHPLSEHVLLHLRYGGDTDVRHVLACVEGDLVGYAHLDVTDEVAGSSAEIAVDPEHRRLGVGQGLVRRAQQETPDGRLRLWAHGEESGAAPLAASLGFRRTRTLFQMRRSLLSGLPEPVWAEGVSLRSFLPGLDDDEWVALNARSFVDLPDQASWTIDDLHVRMHEPWFDAEGFLVAERHEPIGEVYVVGVDPGERGLGLGRALTLAGLQHLRRRGLPDAMLYVDAENTSAIALYESLGFTRWDTDVEFSS